MREIKHAERKVVAAMSTLEQLGYTYHGGELWKPPIAEAAKEPEHKEWPVVDDDVAFPSGKGILVVDKPDINGIIIVKSTDADSIDEYKKVSFNALKKPLTQEEELATKITQLENFDITGRKALVLAKAIINGEIKGLSYKPE